MIKNTLSIDGETIPNANLIKLEYPEYKDLSDLDAVNALKEKLDTGFLPIVYHKIVALSFTFLTTDLNGEITFQCSTIEGETEKDIISNFIKIFDKLQPTLLGWNTKGFDLPVLNYRMTRYGITSTIMFKKDDEYKYDNYTNRYHTRHIDLMDVMGNFSTRASLDTVCLSMGLPGKFSFDRDVLYEEYLNGKIKEINEYCELDTLNVMVLYIKWLRTTNALSNEGYAKIISGLRVELRRSPKLHLFKFEQLWND